MASYSNVPYMTYAGQPVPTQQTQHGYPTFPTIVVPQKSSGAPRSVPVTYYQAPTGAPPMAMHPLQSVVQTPQFVSSVQPYGVQQFARPTGPKFSRFSVELPGTSQGNETNTRRSTMFPNRLLELPFDDEPQVNTAFHVLARSAAKFPSNRYLGHREYLAGGQRGDYKWETYSEVYGDVIDLGLGLSCFCGLTSGPSGEGQARLGMYGINRPEWTKLMMAAWSQRLCIVPLYDTLGPDAARYIIDHAELQVVCCENSKVDSVLKANTARHVRMIVTFDALTREEMHKCLSAGVQAVSVADLIARGRTLRQSVPPCPPFPQDWAVIMYTSGTTGDPKGVLLTHRNNMASISGLLRGTQGGLPAPGFFIDSSDVYISFLPLAHIYEATLQVAFAVVGASIGFYAGDPLKMLTDDIPLLKPTILAAVPRIYSRIYDKLTQGIAAKGAIASLLFKKGFAAQAARLEAGRPRSKFYDKLLFSKLQGRFGGRIRVMASAAAPLPAALHNFLRVVFNCPVLQAYGMTENAGAATGMSWDSATFGTVGGPYPAMELKLQDTEDYKCTDVYPRSQAEFDAQWSFKGAFDPAKAGQRVERGEVCLRGPNVSQGYFKNAKDTAETFDADGWLHTGDVGMWNADGSLQIVDRKKNIFKLAQGEYVAPESVEGAIAPCKYVGQVFVYGASVETCCVAVVVPDRDMVMGLPQAAGKSLAQVVALPEVKRLILDDMTATAKTNGMRGFEIPKDVHFETEVNKLGQGFTVDNECLTPTFKPRRPQLTKRYQKALDDMYAKMKK